MLMAVLGPMIIPCKHKAHNIKTKCSTSVSTIHIFLMRQILLTLPSTMAAMLYVACLNSLRHVLGTQNQT